jgi:imidazole glycerol-phosphate synthase subunit HisH
MTNVVVIDYGIGNLKSVERSLNKVGASVRFSKDPKVISNAERLVLPGVGAFQVGMQGLTDSGVIPSLNTFVQGGKPLLGICLGMQILFDKSEEHGLHYGLGYIPGTVVKILQKDKNGVRKIPHIGWNALYSSEKQLIKWSKTILTNTKRGEFFYFVHSYMAVPENNSDILAKCEYEGAQITAAIKRDNIIGLQFHPEKSGESGLKILAEFVNGKY